MLKLGFYFCLRLTRQFFRHPKFENFRILKKKFFLIYILSFHRKTCRLFPCRPIFKGFFLLKSVKSVCICDYDKDRIVTCEKCVFHFELGHKQKSGPSSPKIYR